jgi:hypothetical protein
MDDRSPLKQKPLRNPGQSVDEEIDRLVNDKFLGFLLFPMMFWIFAWMEWIQKLLKVPRMPAIYAAAATLFTIVAAYQFWRLRRRVRNLKLGRDGEREVAEVLETLKEEGAQVIHDVPGNNFNIDHIVVSTRGIYAIETKTWRKRKNQSRIEFDGERVTISGKPSEFDPTDQCRAQAAWVRDLLKLSTTKHFPVRGVVVFPTWWVEQLPGAANSDLWVLNPKALVKWIASAPEIWDRSDAAMAALHLRQYVRSKAA